jgi:membrane fusion protein (multidrug efflux system)
VRAKDELEGRRAEAAAARLGIKRLDAQQIATEREQRGQLGALVRQRVNLEGQRAAAAAAITRLERVAEERQIRAPIDGRVGEIAPLFVGAVIHEGERLASIVPEGRVSLVAEFPASALGHVRTGQKARFRLDGFPWTQYGYVQATVQRVATETRNGHVQIELAVHHLPSSSIRLEHGLPGAVEIEVERVAPVALLVRTLGHALAAADAREEPDPSAAMERAGR